MFLPNLKPDENELRRLFEQNLDLETLHAGLLQLFQGNKINLCDFIYFSCMNDLYRGTIGLSLEAIFLRTAQEIGLYKYVQSLWVLEQESPSTSVTMLFVLFLKSQKFGDLFKSKIEDLRQQLEQLFPNFVIADAVQQIKAEIANLPNSGPEPAVFGVIANHRTGRNHLYFDNFEESDQVIQRVKAIASNADINLTLDFPISLPQEIPIEDEELLTPFPFVLEAPVLNPCLRYNLILKDLLANLSKLSEDELSVS